MAECINNGKQYNYKMRFKSNHLSILYLQIISALNSTALTENISSEAKVNPITHPKTVEK